MYIWGVLMTGLPPLIWGAYLHYEDLMKHINGTGDGKTPYTDTRNFTTW